MERLSRKHEVSWADLKVLATKKFVGFHSYETSNASVVYIIEDGKPSFWTAIFKAGDSRYDDDSVMQAVRTEWVAHYEPFANGPTKPRDYDGRDKTQPITLSSNQWHYWHSRGDTALALREGEQFILSNVSSEEDVVKVWQYRDPVWMAGGSLKYKGAEVGDHVTFVIYAPATPVVPNISNTGNSNLVFPGIIVPAPDNDGAYDVDLENAHPVPAPEQNGYWNYELSSNMKFGGTITAGEPGSSKYLLIAARLDLTMFIAEELLLGDGQQVYEPQNINASLCLPEWRFECRLHNENHDHTVDVVWRVLVSRYWTTV